MTKKWKKKVTKSKAIISTPLFPGVYPAYAEYAGENYYSSSEWSPEEYPDWSQLEIRYKTEWQGTDVTVEVLNTCLIRVRLIDYNGDPLCDTDVNYLWQDGGTKTFTKTDSEGYLSLEYTPERVETRSITFRYKGTKKLAPSWKTIYITSTKLTPTLTFNNVSVYPGELFILSAQILNKTVPLQDKDLDFTIKFDEEETVTVTSNNSGYANSDNSYIILKSGSYPVTVTYTPSKNKYTNGVSDYDNFNSASVTGTVTIKNQIKCKLSIDAPDVEYGTLNTITLTLTEKSGTPIQGAIPYLTIGGVEQTVPETDSNGVTTIKYQCNTAGSISVIGSYSNPKYADVKTSTKMNVTRIPVTITASATTPKYGAACTVTAKLTETATGTPLSNMTLYLRDGDGKTYKQSKTDTNGQVTLTYTPSHVGSTDYYIFFNQTPKYQSNTTPVTITVGKLDTNITGETEYTLYVGTSTNITVKLEDENNNELDGQKITVNNGTKNTTYTTTSNGVITWTHKANTAGTTTYNITFNGTSIYNSQTYTINVISEKRPTSLEFYQKISGEGWRQDSATKITANAFLEIGMLAQLTDLSQATTNGEDLPLENIPIKIQWKNTTSGKTASKTVTLNTDQNGLVSQLVQGELNDTHTLQFIFEGNDYYLPSNTTEMQINFQRTQSVMYRNNISVFKKDTALALDVKAVYLDGNGYEKGISGALLKYTHPIYANTDYNEIPMSGDQVWATATTNSYGVASATHTWSSNDDTYKGNVQMGVTTKYPFNEIEGGSFFASSIWYTIPQSTPFTENSFAADGNGVVSSCHYRPDYTFAKQFNNGVISNISPTAEDTNLVIPYGVIVCTRMFKITGSSTCTVKFRLRSSNTKEYGVILGLSTSIGRWNSSSDTPLRVEYVKSEGVLKVNGSSKNVELDLNKDYTMTVVMKNNKITKCSIAGADYNLNINVASYFNTPVGLKLFAFCSHGVDDDTCVIVKEFTLNPS